MKLLQFILFSFFFIGLLSCGREGEPAVTDALTITEKDNSRMVSFKGRSIDLTPFVE